MKYQEENLRGTAKRVAEFLSKTFSNVCVDGPHMPVQMFRENRFMVVSTHRSHVDYFLLGAIFWNMGLRNIRYAAGDNLTRLPYIGTQFRSMGAFTVERDRTYGKRYLLALCNQVADMIAGGDSVVVFPESGRSYKGNMMEVRGGMIGAHLLSQHRNPQTPHVFLPVAISYERLPELLYFDMLQKGKHMRKTKKNFFGTLRGNIYYFGSDLLAFTKFFITNRVGKKQGEVFVDYAMPVALSTLTDLDANYCQNARDELSAHRISLQQVSLRLYEYFLSLYRLLPMHCVSYILKRGGSTTRARAAEKVGPLMDYLQGSGRNCKSLRHLSASAIVEKGVEQLAVMKGITLKNGAIRMKNRSVIKYYAAAISPVKGGAIGV